MSLQAKGHAAVVEEVSRVRRRGARLAKLLAMDPFTIAAALAWKAKAHAHLGEGAVGHAEHGGGGGDDDDHHFEGSAPSVLDSADSVDASTSVASDFTSDQSAATKAARKCLERCNLFAPAALRHSALAGLGVVHAHCQQKTAIDRSYRAAFLAGGSLETLLLGAYYTFAENAVLLDGEKEALSTGLINYGCQSKSDGNSLSSNDTSETASVLPLEKHEKQLSFVEPAGDLLQALPSSATAAAAVPARSPLVGEFPPTLAEQSRQHLRLLPLLERVRGGDKSPLRAIRALTFPDSHHQHGGGDDEDQAGEQALSQRALSRRTSELASAVLSQVDSADLYFLETSRSSALRKLDKERSRFTKTAAVKAAASSAKGMTANPSSTTTDNGGKAQTNTGSSLPPVLPPCHQQETRAALPVFASPLALLNKWQGCAPPPPLPSRADKATVAVRRRARSVVQSVS